MNALKSPEAVAFTARMHEAGKLPSKGVSPVSLVVTIPFAENISNTPLECAEYVALVAAKKKLKYSIIT